LQTRIEPSLTDDITFGNERHKEIAILLEQSKSVNPHHPLERRNLLQQKLSPRSCDQANGVRKDGATDVHEMQRFTDEPLNLCMRDVT